MNKRRSLMILLSVLVLFSGCTRTESVITSLLEQTSERERLGSWRFIVDESLQAKPGGTATALLNRQDQASTLKIAVETKPGEQILAELRYGRRWQGEGEIEIRSLHLGEIGTSVKTVLRDRIIRLSFEIPPTGADTLEIMHHLAPGMKFELRTVHALALPGGTDEDETKRAKRVLGWLSRERLKSAEKIPQLRKIPVSKTGRTLNCAVLIGGDTIEFAIPQDASDRELRSGFTVLSGAPVKTSAIRLDIQSGSDWKALQAWTLNTEDTDSWMDAIVPPGNIPAGCRAIRFSLSDENVFAGIVDPLFLPPAESKSERKNLILIDLDTLRADRLGSYGYRDRPTSERLQPLLEEKGFFLFEHTYSASPWTLPSTAKFFTSRYLDIRDDGKIPARYTMMAETLRSNGYFCTAFTGGGALRIRGFEQGFHDYRWSERLGKVEDVFPSAEAWLQSWEGGPFFMFLHTYETHTPFSRDTFCRDLPHGRLGDLTAGEKLVQGGFSYRSILTPEEKQYARAAYDGGVRKATDAVADLFLLMEDLGLWSNSVVVILSDHGEEFWDHFTIFGEHGHSLYNEVLRVPFIIHTPDIKSDRLTCIREEVSTVDLLPTLLDLLDLNGDTRTDGVSLEPLMHGQPLVRDIPILAVLEDKGLYRYCVIADGHKYIEPVHDPRKASLLKRFHEQYPPEKELYRLTDDPEEQENIFRAEDPLTAEMAEKLRYGRDAALEPMEAEMDEKSGSAWEDVRGQLRALGYFE